MLNSRYIELTSSNRDRSRFPNPANFIVELSLAGNGNSSNSRDPVYNSVIKYPPPNTEPPTTYETTGYMYGSRINGGGFPSDTFIGIIPILNNTNNQLKPLLPSLLDNSFVGDTLELVTQSVGGTTTQLKEYRTIVDYKVSSTEYTTTTIDGTAPILITSAPLIATLACDIDNFFTGWSIEFTSTTDASLEGVIRTIEYYRGYDRRVFFNEPITSATITAADGVILRIPLYELRINAPFTIGALPNISGSCSYDDNTTFRIRSSIIKPLNTGTLIAGTDRTFTLPASVGTYDFTGHSLWITTNPIVLSGALTSASSVVVGGTQVQGTFVLPVAANAFPDDFLNNMTINITSGAFSGHSWIITNWDVGTLTGTITPGWTSLTAGTTAPNDGDTFTIVQPNPSHYRRIISYDNDTRVGVVDKRFSYTNVQGRTTNYSVSSSDSYEILQYSNDNYSPLNYAESMVHQQNGTCYEITLVSLTLPNVPIKTGYGGSITQYPYVYIKFKSISKGNSSNDFNSNNPVVSKNMMFRALRYDNITENAAFITFTGGEMVQLLNFSPNTAFEFGVYLPNGDLFITQQDYLTPSATNPLLQVSVLFGVKRMCN